VFIKQKPKKKDPPFEVEVSFDPGCFKTLRHATKQTPVETVIFRYTYMFVALSSTSNTLFHGRLFSSTIKVEQGQDERSLTSGAFINVASAGADADNQTFLVCGFAKHKRSVNKNDSLASHVLNGQVYAIPVKVRGCLLCRRIPECVFMLPTCAQIQSENIVPEFGSGWCSSKTMKKTLGTCKQVCMVPALDLDFTSAHPTLSPSSTLGQETVEGLLPQLCLFLAKWPLCSETLFPGWFQRTSSRPGLCRKMEFTLGSAMRKEAETHDAVKPQKIITKKRKPGASDEEEEGRLCRLLKVAHALSHAHNLCTLTHHSPCGSQEEKNS
jgi:hypothetical protein